MVNTLINKRLQYDHHYYYFSLFELKISVFLIVPAQPVHFMITIKNLLTLFLAFAFSTAQAQDKLPRNVRDNIFLSKLIYYHNNFHPQARYEISNGFMEIVEKDGKFGIYNKTTNTWFATPKYDAITRTANALQNGVWANLLFSKTLNDYQYNDPLYLIIEKDGRKGLMTAAGDTVLPPQYDEVRHTEMTGLFLTRNGQKWGYTSLINRTVMAPPQYDHVLFDKGSRYNFNYHVSRPVIVTYKNKVKTGYTPNGTPYKNKGFKAAKKNKTYHENERTDDYSGFDLPLAYQPDDRIIFNLNGKYGIEDLNRKEIVPARYDYIKALEDGNFEVYKNSTKDQEDAPGMYGIIDKNGKEIVPCRYGQIQYIPPAGAPVLYLAGTKDRKAIYNSNGTELYPADILNLEFDQYRVTKNTAGEPVLWFAVFAIQRTPGISYAVNGKEIDAYQHILFNYEKGVLKPTLLSGNTITFNGGALSNIVVTADNASKGELVFNLADGSYKTGFKRTLPKPENRLLASKIGKGTYEFLIDSIFTAKELPYPVVSANDRYMLARDKDNVRVLDHNGKDLGISYPELDYLYDNKYYFEFNNYGLQKKMAHLFKFRQDRQNPKYGIVDATGKILVKAGIYDAVEFGWRNAYTNLGTGRQKYFYKVLLAHKKADDNGITDVYFEDKKIASFPYNKKYVFAYTDITSSNQLIINTKDSVKLYNLGTHKYDLAIPAGINFIEQPLGGFYNYQPYNNGVTIIQTYDATGSYTGDIYEANHSQVSKISVENGKFGIRNAAATVMIPFVNDTLYSLNHRHFVAKRGTKYGVVSGNNTTIIPFDYDAVSYKKLELWSKYKDEFKYFLIRKGDKYNLYNEHFKLLIPALQDTIAVSRYKYIIANEGAKHTVYDLQGTAKFSMECDRLEGQYDGYFYFYKNGLRGIADAKGHIILPPLYKNASMSLGVISMGEGDKRYVIDGQGNKLLPFPIRDAYAIYSENEMYDHATTFITLSVDDKKNGLYTTDFKELIPPIYAHIHGIFLDKYAVVQQGIKFGVVDTGNRVIIPFEYDNIDYLEVYNYFVASNSKTTNLFTPQGTLLETKKND